MHFTCCTQINNNWKNIWSQTSGSVTQRSSLLLMKDQFQQDDRKKTQIITSKLN